MSTYFQKKQSERTGLQELLGGQTGMQPSVGTDCLVGELCLTFLDVHFHLLMHLCPFQYLLL